MVHFSRWLENIFLTPNTEPEQENSSRWKAVLDKIWKVVKIIFLALLGAGMFAVNPTIFSLGFICGIIWDDKVEEIIEKVKLIWETQTWGVLLLTGFASFLALQVTWAAGTFLYAANIGCKMIKYAKKIKGETLEEQLT